MKKIFTLIAAMLCVTGGVMAAEQHLDLTALPSGWSSSYDATTKTITFDAAWVGRGWWLEDTDYSAYTKVVVETEALAGYAKVIVEYVDGTITPSVGEGNAGGTKLEAILDETGAAHVKQIYIQSGFAGTITLKDAYLTDDAVDLSKIWEGEANLGTEWDWNSTLGLSGGVFGNVNSGDALVIEYRINGEKDYHQLKVLFGQWGNQDHRMPSALVDIANDGDIFDVENGTTSYSIVLTDEDIATLKSEGLRISGCDLTLTKIRSVVSTGISETIAASVAKTNANAPIYNLAGQQVTKSYKGVVIQNGKKFMNK